MKDFVSVREAREIILEHSRDRARDWPEESVALLDAMGRTLAKDIHSADNHPSFASSAMDGYAIGAGSPDQSYRVRGESRAGHPFKGELEVGEAVRIATGAVVPKGTRTVVPVEQVEHETSAIVSFWSIPADGTHIREPGKDVGRGELVVRRGSVVGASVIPMLAMLGIDPVLVQKHPRVRILTTGDELVDANRPDPLGPGMIRDSNAPGLAAMALTVGATVVGHSRAADTPRDLTRHLIEAMDSDVILISGGVSVGAHDHVRDVLSHAGVELLFWRVRQRPGKPLAYGTNGSTAVFALPGNPVSSAICFDQYVRPAIYRLLGREVSDTRFGTAVLAEPLEFKRGLYNFVRGRAEPDQQGILEVRPTGSQDSNLISSITRANCLIHIEEDVEQLETGDVVRIEWFRY